LDGLTWEVLGLGIIEKEKSIQYMLGAVLVHILLFCVLLPSATYFFERQTVRKVVEEPCRLEHRIYGSRYHKKNQNGLRTVHDVFWMFL